MLAMRHSLGLLSVRVSEKSSLWTARILVRTVFTDERGLASSPEQHQTELGQSDRCRARASGRPRRLRLRKTGAFFRSSNKLLTKWCHSGLIQRTKPTESHGKINYLRFPTGLQNLHLWVRIPPA